MSIGTAQIIEIDNKNCKACDHCVSVCPTNAIGGRLGEKHYIKSDLCTSCGQCLINCPFGTIHDASKVEEIYAALDNPQKYVVVQAAPAVRVALGEEFGMAPGTNAKGKMFAALKELGFDKVYDTEFTADLTIMEEGTELIHRVYGAFNVEGYENAGPLPQFTSCCPAWVLYAERKYPQILPYVSTAKSPQQMFGALAKTYLPEKLNTNVQAKDIYSVALMPCTGKKAECERPEYISSGYQDVDAVITTRELAKMIKDNKINYKNLNNEELADKFMGDSTGAATIFGVTGGVMEAALRTAYEILSGEQLGNLNFEAIRGFEEIREASVEIPIKALGQTLAVNVCIVNGLEYVDKVVEDVLAGRSKYHFIEVMNCPGGCINGGGQPIRRDAY